MPRARKHRSRKTYTWCILTQTPTVYIVGQSQTPVEDEPTTVVLDNPVILQAHEKGFTFETLDMVVNLHIPLGKQIGAGYLKPGMEVQYKAFLDSQKK